MNQCCEYLKPHVSLIVSCLIQHHQQWITEIYDDSLQQSSAPIKEAREWLKVQSNNQRIIFIIFFTQKIDEFRCTNCHYPSKKFKQFIQKVISCCVTLGRVTTLRTCFFFWKLALNSNMMSDRWNVFISSFFNTLHTLLISGYKSIHNAKKKHIILFRFYFILQQSSSSSSSLPGKQSSIK
jgi:hypothetical protein